MKQEMREIKRENLDDTRRKKKEEKEKFYLGKMGIDKVCVGKL